MRRLLPIAIVFLPIAILYGAGGLEFLERGRMDVGFRLSGREASSDVVVVEIDPKSLSALGVWPWPRGYHATVLERLLDDGAARVGFDIDFSSRSIGEEDATLAAALSAGSGRVILPVFRQWQESEPDERHVTMVQPLPEFARHATLASINVRPESDGLVRRYANRTPWGSRMLPSFAAALAGDPRPGLAGFYLDYSIPARAVPRVSYVDVLTGQHDADAIRGKRVIVGATAVELGDQIAVPIAAALPGPLLQALAVESLTRDRALIRTGRFVTLIVVLGLALLVAPSLGRRSWQAGLLLTLSSCAVALVAAGVIERTYPVLFDVMPWVVTSAGMYAFALVARVDQQSLRLLAQRMKIRRTEALMRHVVQNSFDAIVTLDCRGTVETFNRAAEFLFGYAESDARGLALGELVGPLEGGPSTVLLDRAAEGPTEADARSRDGRRFTVEVVVTRIETGEEPKLVAVIRDITERKAHQAELEHQATHDPLTNLPNRILLLRRIEEAIDAVRGRGESISVLLLDLDRFKEINDALGHAVGDRLLIEVARRLERPLGPGDTLARLGGDEFAVLLHEAGEPEATKVALNLLDSLRRPFHVDGFSLEVDTSLGITIHPDHGDDAETLVQRADVAMYVAKTDRSGFAVYRPEEDFDHVRQLTIRGELRQAIEGGLLSLVYQPKVHHGTDQVIGAEALLRWNHPVHGPIPPDEFIEIAEHSGLIRSLTQWVLETALADARKWKRAGIPLGISINLSARNLLEEDLPERVQNLMARHETAAHHLTLEITESVIMDDPDRSLRTMERLRQLGIIISVDDFGTGYSSLAYLMKLPVNELKIDKSFVTHIDRDPGSATIVRSTVDLAHKLGMLVVAEGVESEKIWAALKRIGCDVGQGYYFSRPVSVDALLALICGDVIADSAPPIPTPTDALTEQPAL